MIQPAVLEASLDAAAAVERRRRQMTRHWQQRVERARYEADRAARQHRACEPENRLVARTLERRWEEALEAVQRSGAEFDRYTRTQPRLLGEADRGRIRRLAAEVPALWQATSTTPADRRQVVRLSVGRVVLTLDPGDDRVTVRVEWAGGVVRERVIHRPVRGYKAQQSWVGLSERLAALHGRGETPEAIATVPERAGFRPPKRASRFTSGMVRRLLHELGLRRACRARLNRRGSCRRGSGRYTTWHETWRCHRTRCTGGGRGAGFTPGRSAAVAVHGRCGRTPASWPDCGR